MPSATDVQICRDRRGKSTPLDRKTAWLLFASLAAFSFVIGDYSLIGVRIVSIFLFLLSAVYLAAGRKQPVHLSLAFACPFAMGLYGLGQIMWSPQRIVFNALDKSLFWFTVALVALLATQLFQKFPLAIRTRTAVAFFGSFEALLSILEQASHTGKYLWLFPSGFPDVYGTFAYYNNFAQLIELTLPITLWEALRTRQVQIQYLLLAALQIGAVVASGSRAGAILVFLELLGVLTLAWLKRRETISFTVIVLAIVLSAGFTYVAGFQQVVEKLGKSDQLANRRSLNQSSINMIKTRPLTGWGLGAYVPVYKAFALYDDGTWVNQAHNDYLEWAAEGGIPYACILLILILWIVRPAIRSIWAIGLLALCLHALVDYPFARLGTCGWFFCLAGMLAAQGNEDPDKRDHRRRRSRREPQMQDVLTELTGQTLIAHEP